MSLNALHEALAKVLKDEMLLDHFDGETGEKLPKNPALLNVVARFLKDNNVTAVKEKSNPLAQLAAASLPFLQDELKNDRLQ